MINRTAKTISKETNLRVNRVKVKIKNVKMCLKRSMMDNCRLFATHKLQFLMSNSARRMSDAVQGKENGERKRV